MKVHSGLTGFLLACAAMASSAAFGSTYNFDALSTSNEQPGTPGMTFDPGVIVTDGSGSLVVTTQVNNPTTHWVYLDAGTKSGLGVCQLTDGGCAGKSDDNMTGSEWLDFNLTNGETFNSMTIFGNHVNYSSSTIWIDIDGGGNSWTQFTVAGNQVSLFGLLGGDGSTFSVRTGDTREAYVGALTTLPSLASDVPIPAAAWLFGSALLGLGALKRRKA